MLGMGFGGIVVVALIALAGFIIMPLGVGWVKRHREPCSRLPGSDRIRFVWVCTSRCLRGQMYKDV